MNAGFVHAGKVPAAAAGRTVLDHLSERHRHASRREWQARIERGEVRVDGAAVDAAQVLRAGQWLAWHRPPWQEPAVPLCFAVLHRDPDLLVVAKPAGLPTLPAGGEFLEHTLLHQLRRRFPGATPVHRLGRGTSGLVACALGAAARRHFSVALRDGRVRKTYRARVMGRPAAATGTIRVPIGSVPHALLGLVAAAAPGGKPACSHYRLLESAGDTSLLEVEIETGRTHQIRIHLAALGHPLQGDPFYRAGGIPAADALPGQEGYWLHAQALELPARDGRRLQVECAPPLALCTSGEAHARATIRAHPSAARSSPCPPRPSSKPAS